MTKSAIVIGAGFSGLSSAAYLAKAGYNVTVVEKNASAGGRARKHTIDGFTFDMGPSWYWMPEVFERFFADFGKRPDNYYELVRIDPSYRVYWADEIMDIPTGIEDVCQLFESVEKGAGEKLRSYLKQAGLKYEIGINKMAYKPGQSIMELMDWEIIRNAARMDLFQSVSRHIAKSFKTPKLRQLLEFPMLFLGALPQDTPALYSLMNYADIVKGTWYPVGGMHSVVEAMQDLCKELKVEFRFNEAVEEVIIHKKKAVAVATANFKYPADIVVGTADYNFIETSLLAKESRSYSETYWEKKILAPSCLIWYIGLNSKIKLPHHSLFFDVPFKPHADQIYKDPQWPDEPLFYVCAPSVTDPSVAPPGCENLFLLIPVASGLATDDDALRERYFNKVMARLEKLTDQNIQELIIYKKSYGVSDFVTDYNSYKGNAYGLANTLFQTSIFRPGCRSRKVKNLFYAGQFTVPGPGVPPAIISGRIVSEKIKKSYDSSAV
ncbi:MAG TPA: phytoene desaturase family protein [Flavobacterium sp.]|jgi:phytoene desaturase